jgi:uncharacterized protein YndB with AHSA1/START domain
MHRATTLRSRSSVGGGASNRSVGLTSGVGCADDVDPREGRRSVLNQPEPACLVIADISGYTGFLAGAELDHAQDILADLMATVVAAFRPTFKLAKLEGDAAFVYAITATIDPAQLQDVIERCYFGFRRRLRDIRQASACECNACVLVPNLDLKVVAHHGRIVRQRIASWEELVGSDVIIVHRLLKNRVEEATGFAAYVLYSGACVAAMGLDDPAAAGLTEHREEFEGVGEVVGWARDLQAAWVAEEERARVLVTPKDSARTFRETFDAPPAVVWDWVTSPARRLRWQAGVTGIRMVDGTPGRRGVGTVNHCVHGKDAIIEEVLDWRPYDYVTYRSLLPIPGVPKLLNSFVLEEFGDGGTAFEMRFGSPRSAKERAIAAELFPALDESVRSGMAALRPLIEADAAERRALAATAAPEPDIPAGQARNVREPIAAGA